MDEIYELGFKLGKSGVFSKGQMMILNSLFFNACNKDRLIQMILIACKSENLIASDLLMNNLYDLEIKSNFLVGLLNGSLNEKELVLE
ncbi:TPA: hypothetical protein ACG3P3_001488 [Clostridioides difficile]